MLFAICSTLRDNVYSIHIYFLHIFLPSNNCLAVHVGFTEEMFSCMDNVGIKLKFSIHRENCFKCIVSTQRENQLYIYLMLEDFHWSVDIHFAICIHVVVYAKTCISPMQLFIMKLNYF